MNNMLKVCPWCGCEAIITEEWDAQGQRFLYKIGCKCCGESTEGFIRLADAVEKWNGRIDA